MGFSSKECWSALPRSPPGDLPNPGIEPGFPVLQGDSLPSEPLGKPHKSTLLLFFLMHNKTYNGKESDKEYMCVYDRIALL